MNPATEKKTGKMDPRVPVLAGVLVLALVGVGVSWKLNQAPAAPAAEGSDAPPAVQSSAGGTMAQMSEEAARLMAAVQAGLAADAQAVAAEWPAWVAPKAAPAAAAAKPADRVFRLRGMIHGGDRPTAFLDDKVLLVGEEIDGYTLEEIATDHVVLVDPRGKRIELYPEAGP